MNTVNIWREASRVSAIGESAIAQLNEAYSAFEACALENIGASFHRDREWIPTYPYMPASRGDENSGNTLNRLNAAHSSKEATASQGVASGTVERREFWQRNVDQYAETVFRGNSPLRLQASQKSDTKTPQRVYVPSQGELGAGGDRAALPVPVRQVHAPMEVQVPPMVQRQRKPLTLSNTTCFTIYEDLQLASTIPNIRGSHMEQSSAMQLVIDPVIESQAAPRTYQSMDVCHRASHESVQSVTMKTEDSPLEPEPQLTSQPQLAFAVEPQQDANALNSLNIFASQSEPVLPSSAQSQVVPAQFQPAQAQFQSSQAPFQPAQAQFQPAQAQFQPAQAQFQPAQAQFQPLQAQPNLAGSSTPVAIPQNPGVSFAVANSYENQVTTSNISPGADMPHSGERTARTASRFRAQFTPKPQQLVEVLRPLVDDVNRQDQYDLTTWEDSDTEKGKAINKARANRPEKRVPEWCTDWRVKSVEQQSFDPDTIFGTHLPKCDLDGIFTFADPHGNAYMKARKGKRGSSAVWTAVDALSTAEIETYKHAMGQHIKADVIITVPVSASDASRANSN